MERQYLTLEEKIGILEETIFQGFAEDFDDNYTEEEIDQMLEDNTYFEKIREQFIGYKGYEKTTFNELCEMPYENMIEVYNMIRGDSLTLQGIKDLKVYWTRNFGTAVEK